ncbi:MAG: uroporphyrinogen-III synthase [Rhodoferax sp.]|uniref:uroporphyrinogen-III synthase n=1 Tax=Rhodoferax sp. TaxID=50421 RepID=UPI002611C4C9|nr:uroporphyrinogen-III synthase [Rhodoferax sp.]MDD5333077.1 uroporphyrinogen-III synthase [Rhodoferax sp.]
MTRVIVTRAQREAKRWASDLSAQGFEALALPLIAVGPVADTAALKQAWRQLDNYLGVMFVSANAADYFFASKPPSAPDFSAQSGASTRAWATGPGTARALLRLGVAPQRIDAPAADAGQFDSEALWQLIGSQVRPGQRVLIVRGADAEDGADSAQGSGRAWFAQRVAAAGAQPEFVVAYQRSAPEFSGTERELARQAASDGSVWLFSSAQALANLKAALPGQSWLRARALATHPRIASAAKIAGFGVVCESRPTLAEVVAALKLADEP